MKLRIKGNSLRLRVSRSEVARLLTGASVEEAIQFAPGPDARFTYALKKDALVSEPTIQYADNRVAVLVPANQANTWGATDQIGISEIIDLGETGVLALLIEKDFACLDRSDEDNQDTFPNPNAGNSC